MVELKLRKERFGLEDGHKNWIIGNTHALHGLLHELTLSIRYLTSKVSFNSIICSKSPTRPISVMCSVYVVHGPTMLSTINEIGL